MIVNYPVEDTRISQHFGHNVSGDPIYGRFYELFDNKHCGVDFPVPIGTIVTASFPGIVVRAEDHLGMGKVVGVRNGNIVAIYAHLSNASVKLGEIVKSKDRIGLSGFTGNACVKPHLHFELRDISKPSLKEMVFDPPFDKEVLNYMEMYIYTVNNRNTQKTLKKLSILFFGTEARWDLIKQANCLDLGRDDSLKQGQKLIIPNYPQ